MPEGGHHHVLDAALFAVGEFDFGFLTLLASALDLAADLAGFLGTFARFFAAGFTRWSWFLLAGAGTIAAFRAVFFFF
jgi:hypothetical protein